MKKVVEVLLVKVQLERAIEMERQFYVRKYKGLGEWTDWKEVAFEVAMHKMSVAVYNEDDDCFYHPYQVGVEEYRL